ncbi:MAG TPA: hypothetical protein EYP85_07400 [Armatimonadetes bacterium]|nr:hypothetical protein [Armatimonadota bacterium]
MLKMTWESEGQAVAETPTAASLEPREEFLFPGQTGLGTCLTLSEEYAALFAGRKFMERGKVKEVPVKVVQLRDLILRKYPLE